MTAALSLSLSLSLSISFFLSSSEKMVYFFQYTQKILRNYNPDAQFCHIGYSKVNTAPSMLFTVFVSMGSYF